jgi:hypothetical protein
VLSVLIPVFNFHTVPLVERIAAQCRRAGIDWEIRVCEDGSTAFLAQNAALRELPGIHYEAYSENRGRAAMRNFLARQAHYPHLLFLDCDSMQVSDSFIHNYLTHRQHPVVYGGTHYAPHPDPDHSLHHLYGTHREALPFADRRAAGHSAFRTNNFLVHKGTMLRVPFDESLRHYGHEDTLFAIHLKQQGIAVEHIDNPVLHTGLETNAAFLHKSRMALENVIVLHRSGKLPPGSVRVLDLYLRVAGLPFGKWGLRALATTEGYLEQSLLSAHPKLRHYDLLRLVWLHRLMRGSDATQH